MKEIIIVAVVGVLGIAAAVYAHLEESEVVRYELITQSKCLHSLSNGPYCKVRTSKGNIFFVRSFMVEGESLPITRKMSRN